MTYEERQQAICKECNIHDERCAYFTRNMQDDCPKITSRMVGWELGYKDAINKACKWLNNFYNEDTHSYLVKEDIEGFRKAMEGE